MKVDLPTPGTPEMPSRNERPEAGSSALSTSSARARWSARVDSSKRDRLAIARRCRRAGLAAHAVDQRLIGRRQHQPPSALRICASTSRALAGIGVPGPKMPLTPAA